MPRPPFFRLDPDRQAAVVSASMKEFAEHGYRGASTNHIAAESGVSKGSLFYYFEGKDDLYLYCYDQSVKAFEREMQHHRAEWSRDLLQRLRVMTETGLDILVRDPVVFRLQTGFLAPEVAHLRERYMREHGQEAAGEFQYWFGDVERDRLRHDWATTMRLLMWTYVGIKMELAYVGPMPGDAVEFKKALMERLDLVIDVLREALYID